jgi:hypothetical protein
MLPDWTLGLVAALYGFLGGENVEQTVHRALNRALFFGGDNCAPGARDGLVSVFHPQSF